MQSKYCEYCKCEHPLTSEFWGRCKGKDLQVCSRRRRDYHNEYRKKNGEKLREQERARIAKDPEGYKEKCRAYAKTAEGKRKSQGYYRKYRYGIDMLEYARMLEAQNGRCAICGSTEHKGRGTTFCIDHDHVTGKVRGLLCAECNWALGHFRDSPNILVNAKQYLEKQYEPEYYI